MPRAALTGNVPQRGFIFVGQHPIAGVKFIRIGRRDAIIYSCRVVAAVVLSGREIRLAAGAITVK